jgi:hypothetical protein
MKHKDATPEELARQLRVRLLSDIDQLTTRLDALQREITEGVARRNSLNDQLRKLWP